jgi:hypothetical protein
LLLSFNVSPFFMNVVPFTTTSLTAVIWETLANLYPSESPAVNDLEKE